MDAISLRDLHVLASDKTNMCVSIYMTTYPAETEGEKDPNQLPGDPNIAAMFRY